MDGQARRSGTHRRRRWCNRGLVGLHAQVSAVAPNAPTDLPGSDSIRRPREGRLAALLACRRCWATVARQPKIAVTGGCLQRCAD